MKWVREGNFIDAINGTQVGKFLVIRGQSLASGGSSAGM